MPTREQRHAGRTRRTRRWTSWIPEALVALVVVAAIGNAELDLGHRWLGLDRATPGTDPARVLPPEGLDLTAGPAAAPVALPQAPGRIDPAAVRKALAPYVADPDLGKHVSIAVSEVATGKIVLRRGASAVTPASTMKLLTSVAALEKLGPMTRFSTRVVGAGNRIVLVGGGDPFLAGSTKRARGQYPARADIGTLARRTAAALKAQQVSKVTLGYDDSLFSGPGLNPRWPATYLPENVAPPISALWIDQGVVDGRYVANPAEVAANAFATALRRSGITVVGAPRQRTAPAAAAELAKVESAPVGEIVQQTLAVSDNNAAEVLSHQVGLAVSGDGSFLGGAAGVVEVLQGLKIDTAGSRIYDGSGLSRQTLLTPGILLGVLQAAASTEHPELREALTGLPVAGFTGSLQSRFDKGPADALGRVRAKTGTLTGVRGLAGLATDLDGNLMAFVLITDRVPVEDQLAAQHDLDLMAGALGSCHCGP
ncbi:D-alanyl-D-alanine carboxypeptidase/D-alanyl-D-alanine-endopeptidase [Nocardioides marmoriginsengisoli]|uniref:D-alanyl-D-alanine carboxypeptidase/D-alanyl-D-alanine-endopeptidase n=1 Tax=Nocardioides marmoriginsengisoli TaxID=661483 RepID=A0A3N0CFJ2_9ACTN|nr:D-alanyl-D-alanine carboxypeptidase/D-alanyl-D-alanine-endopeptidase [Nocardioides marmoriginsengisoli]RNL62215.1 D-alanyl-D-alanine carboxypeptidase/D-alanyl-D-alanine-endopeptidase [Nocardioides marmoriginsengisoli]